FHGHPLAAAARLKEAVRRQAGLTVSVGIGPNRMLAKLACRLKRPDGLGSIAAGDAMDLLAPRPVSDLPGVGPRTVQRLRELNIATVEQLREVSREALRRLFGAPGESLYDRCRGRDTRAIAPREVPRTISRETSFETPLTEPEAIDGMLRYLAERVGRTLRELGVAARVVGAGFESSDGESEWRARSLKLRTDLDSEIFAAGRDLLWKAHTRRVGLRRLGVSVTGMAPRQGEQGSLFGEGPAREAS